MFRTGIIVMIITMLSRILGLIRTIIIATIFGANYTTDAYFSAFKIANLFRQLLGEGALGTVFIPLYNEKEVKFGEKEAKNLIFSVLNLLFIFLILITALNLFFSKNIISFIANGYDEKTKKLASILLKIMSSYILFIGLSGMICAILNNFKKFIIPASTSLLFNISIIIFAIRYSKNLGVYALATGVTVGGILQLVITLPSFFKIVKIYSFKIDFKDEYLKKIFVLIIPMLAGIFARQINSVFDVYFASYLKSGSVSALENATRIYNLPLGVFAISLSTIIYPHLSKSIEKKDLNEAKSYIEQGLKILAFFIIPSIFILTLYSKNIIFLILGYGKYTNEAIKLTSESLFYYVLGLYFYSAIHLLSRAFYSMKNTKTPVIFSIISIFINIILNYLLIKQLKHIGLALSTSISAMINFLLLYFIFNKRYFKLNLFKIVRFILIVSLIATIAFIVSLYFNNIFIKLFSFVTIYLIIWSYPIKRKGKNVFKY
ncbi:putative peptidoglycan lipid II flippase [Hypnocyclicus thermotrophus]|uniref:Probable lipid II flippase MurJ n=1 Tax=Hypnocyclicus thermotrophus TaxID=1627895 RepID=A0AA46I5Y8_9FUSO|nr:murein biosynthesis integral membrane protein MurJ [Hypnocyclicus thermotrophus]TDT71446.1 putative peptidoglycan lipid II flippase [Hypnocyclicus thermotrophus]